MIDNYDLFEMRELAMEKEIAKLPFCSHCGKRITDESEHGREEGYVGVNANDGIFVSKEDAFAYAFERCVNGTDEEVKEFMDMVVEWFFSGDWLEQKICEE